MEIYSKSIIPIIESRYESFTQSEKHIADFFLKNNTEIDFSSRSISSKLFVSEASLSRFSKKCGFNGYREFIYQYKQTFNASSEIQTSYAKAVLGSYQELLNKTYNLLNESQILRIVNDIYEAGRVVACGKGSSGFVANEMESRFMRIGVDIDSLQDSDRMKMQAVFLNKSSLVCGFSVSGETEPVLYLLKKAHKNGAKTILFTATDKENFSEFCDEIVLISSIKHLNYGNIISPQFPMLLILDVIYNEYLNRDSKNTILHSDTLKALTGQI